MGAKRGFDIQCGDAEGKNCMKKVQSDLLSLLSHMLFHQPTSVTFTDEIKAEAHAQAVSSLITDDYQAIAQNIRVFNAHEKLTEALDDIPFTTFKGYASARYYPQPIRRPMGDVDFIVEPA